MESALSSERRQQKWRSHQESGEDSSEVGSTRSRRSRNRRTTSKPVSKPRTRSGTTSSTQTSTPTIKKEDKGPQAPLPQPQSALSVQPDTGNTTPTRDSFLEVDHDSQGTPEITPSPLEPVAVPAAVGVTDDSDTDFQSAYSGSTSPRGSYVSLGEGKVDVVKVENEEAVILESGESIEDRLSAPPKTRRERVSSTSTAILTAEKSGPPPTSAVPPIPARVRATGKQV